MISKIKVLCNLLLFRIMIRKEKMLLKKDILFLVIFILTFWEIFGNSYWINDDYEFMINDIFTGLCQGYY